MISAALRERVEATLGRRVVRAVPVAGGDINEARELALDDGSSVFCKFNEQAPSALFAAEALGLEFLRSARALRIPEVLGFSAPNEQPRFLLLELIRAARPQVGFDDALGRGLAALHRAGAPSFGFEQPNFIGRLPQSNREHPSWAEFYRAERLEPQLRLATDAGRVSGAMRRGFERLFATLPERVGPSEPPARLHGDLWGGNLHVDEHGAPCLIDPAVYGGHREMDLAMMRLFGGFRERAFAAYVEAYPLAAGERERVALYQLYPLLVHVNLFGGSYVDSVERALAGYV